MRSMLFEELVEDVGPKEALLEYLTYDQLFRMSDPKRNARSANVNVPPMEVEAYQTGGHWIFAYFFNAKSNPGHSTTGLRHRGYVRFRKPKRGNMGKSTPLSQLAVEVDCMCPDYRYRWAWANHQRKAGPIGPSSFNQCDNRAPRKTNPTGKPGLCKHILAAKQYIYGLLSGFPKNVGPSDRLDRLTKRATKRWINFDADMAAARERDAKIALSKARRNIGLPPEDQNKPKDDLSLLEPPPLPDQEVEETPPVTEVPVKPETNLSKKVAAKPPTGKAASKPVVKQPVKPVEKPKKLWPPGEIKGLTPGQFIGRRFLKTEGVDIMTKMKTLSLNERKIVENAARIISEMEDEIGELAGMPDGPEMPSPEGNDMPIEPPVADSAVGASTQDNVALGLLREIRDLLADLAAEEAAEGGEVPELPEEDVEPGEGEGEADLGGGDEFKPGKRPMPVPNGAGE